MPVQAQKLLPRSDRELARTSNLKTIEDVVRLSKDPTSGFDYLRIVLAVSVIAWHAFPISYGPDATQTIQGTPVGNLVSLILPVFFALSGFLVASSLLRVPSLVTFIGLRALRIVPALAVEICLSALVLGPLVTTVPLADYYGSSEFAVYFANIVGRIHYTLPGVFTTNPYTWVVNGSLWTVPYELECYVALAILCVLGLAKKPRPMLVAFLVASAGFFVFARYRGMIPLSEVGLPGRMLILFFLAGVLLRVGSAFAPFHPLVFLVAAVFSLMTFSTPALVYLSPLPVAYVTVYLGLQRPPRLPLLFTGDYSYGLYLYAFPLQQLTAYLLPTQRHWYVNLPVSLVLAFVFAVFSWHVVEKRCLALRRYLTPTRASLPSLAVPAAARP